MSQPNGASGGNGATRVQFLELFDELINAKAKLDSAQDSYRNLFKRGEAMGLNGAMLKASLKLKNQDRDRRESDFSDLAKYLAWLEIPIGTQAEMFGEPEAEPTAEEAEAVEKHKANAAYNEGLYSGRAGANVNSCPYQIGSEEYQQYHSGYHAGQREIAETLGGKPARRGRPRATVEGEPAGNA